MNTTSNTASMNNEIYNFILEELNERPDTFCTVYFDNVDPDEFGTYNDSLDVAYTFQALSEYKYDEYAILDALDEHNDLYDRIGELTTEYYEANYGPWFSTCED